MKHLILLALGWLLVLTAPAQTNLKHTIIKDFADQVKRSGAHPESPLVASPDGTLYGTTRASDGNPCTLYKIRPDGSGFTFFKFFTNRLDGSDGLAGLLLAGDTLYGVADSGGKFDRGTLFKIQTNGTGFSVLKHFQGQDGAAPQSQLILHKGVLYGTTSAGGLWKRGTVFRINPDGSNYQVLFHFAGPNGANPTGRLTTDGSFLYGTTMDGGLSSLGTVFRLSMNGTQMLVLQHFTGQNGANPSGGLTLSQGTLYGAAARGGNHQIGTIFRLKTDGSNFSVLQHFGDKMTGGYPNGDLLLHSGWLYGTAFSGSDLDYYINGTVFRLSLDGKRFEMLHYFQDYTSNPDHYGNNPAAGLVLQDNVLYGTTLWGAGYNEGTIFRIKTDGTGKKVLWAFQYSPWQRPVAGVTMEGNVLYGTTSYGGKFGFGTIYRVNRDGSQFRVLKNFNLHDGVHPLTELVVRNHVLYGTTSGLTDAQKQISEGTIFKINTDGTSFKTLKRMDITTSSLTLDGDTLYGATSFSIFKMKVDGTGFTVLKEFAPDGHEAQGVYLTGRLTLSGNVLYGVAWGTTYYYDGGTLFRLNTDGSNFAVLKYFDIYPTAHPDGGLVLSGNTLYGTTSEHRSVFKINVDGSGFESLKIFSNIYRGSYWRGGLAIKDDFLYGIAEYVDDFDQGGIFQIHTNGSGFRQLLQFQGKNGAFPLGTLTVASDGLYGTTVTGGRNPASGTIFALKGLFPPGITVQPQSQTNVLGASVTLSVTATNAAKYQWRKNGVALAGATRSTLTFSSLSRKNVGRYQVLVSNGSESVLSTNAWVFLGDLFVDAMPPTHQFTSPKKFQTAVTKPIFTLRGTARDTGLGVAQVFCSVNDGPPQLAKGTTNWSAVITLSPGSNYIEVRAIDYAAHYSVGPVRYIFYITPEAAPTVTAEAGVPLSFNGHLIEGAFTGLFFETNGFRADRAGFFTAQVRPGGTFSGRLELAGDTLGFSGQFAADGSAALTVPRQKADQPDLQLQLQLTTNEGEQISGSIGTKEWTAVLAADGAAGPSPTGIYPLLFPGENGDGHGLATVTEDGLIEAQGTFANGETWTQIVPLSRLGQWPFYVATGPHVMLGWLTLANGSFSGDLLWQRDGTDGAISVPSGE